ncbi:MAG: hypothetical protein HY721_06570 [Planctomycetes bacterium]|nr:hypothetical protein [Planctomycetota bacterium]
MRIQSWRRWTGACAWVVLALALALERTAGGQIQSFKFTRGDVNMDGKLTLVDPSFLLDALFLGFSPPPRCVDAVDANDNGMIDMRPVPPDITEVEYLLDWLFHEGPPPPAPFPGPGGDPTPDDLACADASVDPPPPPDPGFKVQWENEESPKPGQKDYELFLLATTARPIQCFSIAYRIDNRFHENVRADFQGTIFPQERRSEYETSPLFRVRTVPSADPDYDLLLVGAVFLDRSFRRIELPATTGPIAGLPLLRVVTDIRADLPYSPRGCTVVPPEEEDGRPGEPGGISSAYGSVLMRNGLPMEVTVTPGTLEGAQCLIIDCNEILRTLNLARGDSNGDGAVDVSDPVFTLLGLFASGPASVSECTADSNGDEAVDISDPKHTLNWLFLGGPAPP